MKMIDLRSDTVTRPGKAMRSAMAEAPVGDDVFGDDPTVIRLETLAAGKLGKEAALFASSGTQTNLLPSLPTAREPMNTSLGRVRIPTSMKGAAVLRTGAFSRNRSKMKRTAPSIWQKSKN